MAGWSVAREDERISVAGEFRMRDARAIWHALLAATRAPGPRLDIDLSKVSAVDGTVMALLVELRTGLIARGAQCEIVGAAPTIEPIVRMYRGHELPIVTVPPPQREGIVRRLGAGAERLVRSMLAPARFFGEMIEGAGQTMRRPGPTSWRSLPVLIERAGTDGIPIVVVLNFLVGFVIVFQSTSVLELYGATIYAADLVGISGPRELAPLITAVIMSGRSGAAFAAELGTMRVAEEIDALRTLGISPVPHLVLPRVMALAIAAPVLTLLADVATVTGGLVVAMVSLDITPRSFLIELQTAVIPSDIWTGLIKSSVFGATIAIIGCYQGLTTTGAAAGVGRSTTATVVHCLFAIVVLDTILTIIFRMVDL